MSTSAILFDDLGPRGRRISRYASVVSVIVFAALLATAVRKLSDKGQFASELWQPFTIWAVDKGLLRGLWHTIEAATLAMLAAMTIGAFMALARLAHNRPVRWISGIYVEFFRAIPIYVLIVFAFLGLPQFELQLSAFWALVLGLTLYNSAMLAEIIRAGILSLDRGQGEAATAIGLTYWQSMRLVIIPQAGRRMVPSLIGQLVALLKDTSLGGALTYVELLKVAQVDANYFGNLLPMLAIAALVYMSVNIVLSTLARRLEIRQHHSHKT